MAAATVDDLLSLLREHTGLDVAFVGEFSAGRRIIRYVSAPGPVSAFLLSRDDDMLDSYCKLIVEGEIDSLIPDVHAVPRLRELSVTSELSIGSYVGVPIRLVNGELYGTLCCFGHDAVDRFRPDVLTVLDVAASLVARKLEAPEHCYVNVLDQQDRIRSLLDDPLGLRIVVQPIVDLVRGEPVGYEALSRFPGDRAESPQVWFDDAHHIGLGVELEVAAVRRALALLPTDSGYLAVNVSAPVLASSELWATLDGVEPAQVLVEFTEQELTRDTTLIRRRQELPDRGIRLAVDDLGAGFSSLSRLLELSPDVLKFDRFLTLGRGQRPSTTGTRGGDQAVLRRHRHRAHCRDRRGRR